MLADTWRMDAASAYFESLQARYLSLEIAEGRLRIPSGHTEAELELVRLLKPELMSILEQDARDLAEELTGILEHDGGFTREEAETRAGIAIEQKPLEAA